VLFRSSLTVEPGGTMQSWRLKCSDQNYASYVLGGTVPSCAAGWNRPSCATRRNRTKHKKSGCLNQMRQPLCPQQSLALTTPPCVR